MEKERLKEMSRFVVVGILATAIHYAIYYTLLPYISHNASFTVGYVVSFLCNYGLSSKYTFRVGTSVQRFVSFGLSHATNYFIQMVLLNLFVGLGVSEPLAPLPVYAVAVPVNYLMVRFALTRSSRENDGYWMFLMVVGFAMLWLNLLDVPTLSDDMIYRFAWQTDDAAPLETIGGLGDLLRSMWTHYLSVNGRFVPHLVAQGLLVFTPPVVMQVMDTLMFVLLIHLSTKWVCDGDSGLHKLKVAVVATTLLFVVFSGFRTAVLWGLGAVNYLWALVAVLALLNNLRGAIKREKQMALLVLALLAGWAHEALSLPVSIAFAAWMIINRRANLCMLVFMGGTLLCLLSPGVWLRAGESVSLQSRIISGVVNMVFNVRVSWLLVIALLVMWKRDRQALREHLSAHRYEYIALTAALGIVAVCGVNLERVPFFADFIAMLLLLRLMLHAPFSILHSPFSIICCVLMLVAYIPAYMVRAENAENWHLAAEQMREPGRELIAVRIPQKGENRVMDYFREHYVNSSFEFGFYCVYMGFDSNDVNMRCAARLYGKERLAFLPEDVVERIESDSTAYTNYELDRNKDLYVWRMNDDRPVKSVTFILNDEDTSKLMPHQRLVAYHGDEYELDDFNFEVLHIGGQPFLVFTKPTTNIYRRIKTINVGQ